MKRCIHGRGIVAEVGDEDAGGEVVEPPAFRRPVEDAGAAGEDGLRGREGPQGARLEAGQAGRGRALEVGFVGVVQREGS